MSAEMFELADQPYDPRNDFDLKLYEDSVAATIAAAQNMAEVPQSQYGQMLYARTGRIVVPRHVVTAIIPKLQPGEVETVSVPVPYGNIDPIRIGVSQV